MLHQKALETMILTLTISIPIFTRALTPFRGVLGVYSQGLIPSLGSCYSQKTSCADNILLLQLNTCCSHHFRALDPATLEYDPTTQHMHTH